MHPGSVIVVEGASQDAAVWRGEDLGDRHGLHALPNVLAVDLITVAQEVGRCGVVREDVHDLLGGAGGPIHDGARP